MEFKIKEIESSTSMVKHLLFKLNVNNKNYLYNVKVAVKAYNSLSDSEKAEIMHDIYIKYKYFDGIEAIKLEESIKNVKPIIKSLLSLNKKDSVMALSMISKLTPMETAILLRNKTAKSKLEEIKAHRVANMFLDINEKDKSCIRDIEAALNEYKQLYPEEKVYLRKNRKAYKKYNLSLVASIKNLLENIENYSTIGREVIIKFDDLNYEYKKYITEDKFYNEKLNMINMFFDKQKSDKIIKDLHNIYLASMQSNLTSDYFAYALRVIEQFEGQKESVKKLVKAQAAFELKVAKDGKDAHPIVSLTETYLPEKTHSKYYEIADIIISAYEFGLTKRQKYYVNKNIYAMELIEEARSEFCINENVI